MKVTRILHSSVNTSKTHDASADFYRDVLGLEPRFRPGIGIPGAWFTVGDAEIHLVGFPQSDAAVDPMSHHVCLGVADLEAAVAELDTAGIEYARLVQHHPDRDIAQVFVADPAGNTIELQQD